MDEMQLADWMAEQEGAEEVPDSAVARGTRIFLEESINTLLNLITSAPELPAALRRLEARKQVRALKPGERPPEPRPPAILRGAGIIRSGIDSLMRGRQPEVAREIEPTPAPPSEEGPAFRGPTLFEFLFPSETRAVKGGLALATGGTLEEAPQPPPARFTHETTTEEMQEPWEPYVKRTTPALTTAVAIMLGRSVAKRLSRPKLSKERALSRFDAELQKQGMTQGEYLKRLAKQAKHDPAAFEKLRTIVYPETYASAATAPSAPTPPSAPSPAPTGVPQAVPQAPPAAVQPAGATAAVPPVAAGAAVSAARVPAPPPAPQPAQEAPYGEVQAAPEPSADVPEQGIVAPTRWPQESPHGPVREGPEELTPEEAAAMIEGRPEATRIIEGRPELANPAQHPAARLMVDAVDEARAAVGVPQPRSDAEVQAEADQRLQVDYAGERGRLLRMAAGGEQLSDTDTRVAAEVIDREALEAIKSGDKAKLKEAMLLADAYRRTGTAQARAFRQRRDQVQTPAQRAQRALKHAILTPPKGKTIDAWADEFAKLKGRLAKRGLDIDDIEELANDPIKAAQALDKIATAKGNIWDAAHEFWRNMILSGLQTNSRNFVSNAAHMVWSFGVERPAEALINLAVRNPNAAQLGEFRHMVRGILPGVLRGFYNAYMSVRTGRPYFEETLGRTAHNKLEWTHRKSISGVKGEAVRIPQTTLQAVDELFKTMNAEIDVGAQAYRIAKAEGLKGQALTDRMTELVLETDSEAWDRAMQTALEHTFQEHPEGGAMESAIEAANVVAEGVPGVRYVTPFRRVLGNIFRQALRKTPLGLPNVLKTLYEGAQGKNWDRLAKYGAEQLIAWSAFGAFVYKLLSLGEDEEMPITGAAGYKTRGKRELSYRTGKRRMSVKVGDEWYGYDGVEPFSTWIALTLDGAQALLSGDPERIVADTLESLVTQAKSKTFMQGISDVLKLTEADNLTDASTRWVSNFAASWIPNLIRQASREAQTTFKERRWSLEKGSVWDKLYNQILKRTELGLIQEEDQYDIWGKPAMRPGQPAAETSLPWRIISPSDAVKEHVFVGDRLILNWNKDHPDEPYYPNRPSPKYSTPDGAKHEMDAKTYAVYSQRAGMAAAKLVERWTTPDREGKTILNVDNPTARDMILLRKAFDIGRQIARVPLIRKWAEGRRNWETIKRIMDLKLRDLRDAVRKTESAQGARRREPEPAVP